MLSIGRFEGDFALCEDETGRRVPLLRTALPADAREGDLLISTSDGRYAVDRTATAARRRAIAKNRDRRLRAGAATADNRGKEP